MARIGRIGRAGALVAIGIVGGGAALAVGSVPSSSGTYTGCVSVATEVATTGSVTSTTTVPYPGDGGGNVNVIDPSLGQSCTNLGFNVGSNTTIAGYGQQQITWNQTGPQGAQGPAGPQGAAGPQGLAGAPGPAGANGATGAPGASATNSPAGTTEIAQVELGSAEQLSPTAQKSPPIKFDAVNVAYGTQSNSAIGSATQGAGAGKISFSTITVTKVLDRGSAELLGNTGRNATYKSGRILIPLPGDVGEYLQISLKLVAIRQDQIVSNQGAEPLENLTFVVGGVELSNVSGDKLGTQKPPPSINPGSWNRVINTANPALRHR